MSSRKLRCALLAALLMATVGLSATAHAQGWQVVQRWSGNGMQDTEAFSVGSRDWQVVWTVQSTGASLEGLDMSINDAASGDVVGVAASERGESVGSTILHNGPGNFYLNIRGPGTRWNVQVTDQP